MADSSLRWIESNHDCGEVAYRYGSSSVWFRSASPLSEARGFVERWWVSQILGLLR